MVRDKVLRIANCLLRREEQEQPTVSAVQLIGAQCNRDIENLHFCTAGCHEGGHKGAFFSQPTSFNIVVQETITEQ